MLIFNNNTFVSSKQMFREGKLLPCKHDFSSNMHISHVPFSDALPIFLFIHPILSCTYALGAYASLSRSSSYVDGITSSMSFPRPAPTVRISFRLGEPLASTSRCLDSKWRNGSSMFGPSGETTRLCSSNERLIAAKGGSTGNPLRRRFQKEQDV